MTGRILPHVLWVLKSGRRCTYIQYNMYLVHDRRCFDFNSKQALWKVRNVWLATITTLSLLSLVNINVPPSLEMLLAFILFPLNSCLNPLINTIATRQFLEQLNWKQTLELLYHYLVQFMSHWNKHRKHWQSLKNKGCLQTLCCKPGSWVVRVIQTDHWWVMLSWRSAICQAQ